MSIYNSQTDWKITKFMTEYQQFYKHLTVEAEYLRDYGKVYRPSQLQAQRDACVSRRDHVVDVLDSHRTWIQNSNYSVWESRLDNFVTSIQTIVDYYDGRLSLEVDSGATYGGVMGRDLPSSMRSNIAGVIEGELG